MPPSSPEISLLSRLILQLFLVFFGFLPCFTVGFKDPSIGVSRYFVRRIHEEDRGSGWRNLASSTFGVGAKALARDSPHFEPGQRVAGTGCAASSSHRSCGFT